MTDAGKSFQNNVDEGTNYVTLLTVNKEVKNS
jgi:hypothetical protein